MMRAVTLGQRAERRAGASRVGEQTTLIRNLRDLGTVAGASPAGVDRQRLGKVVDGRKLHGLHRRLSPLRDVPHPVTWTPLRCLAGNVSDRLPGDLGKKRTHRMLT